MSIRALWRQTDSESDVSTLLLNSYKDVLLYSLMVAMGETFLVAFVLDRGVDERSSAFISTLPVVLGSLLQLGIFRAAAAKISARRWVVAFATIQAAALLCVPLVQFSRLPPFAALMVIATAYWAAGFSAGPVWNGWVTSILPANVQKSFFFLRNAISQLTILGGIIVAGTLLRALGTSNLGFLALFSLAALARLGSAYFLARQPDAANFSFSRLAPDTYRLRELIRQPFVKIGILFSFFTNFAVHISAPFFSPYMLKKLELDHIDYSVLIAGSFLARSLSGYALEKFLRIKQSQAIFKIGVFGIILAPALWTLSDSYLYLFFLQILSGLFWGCHELGLTLLLVEKIEHSSRLRILSVTNVISSLGMMCGCLVGWKIAASGEIPKSTYHSLFILSTCLRFIPVAFSLKYVRLADHWQPAFRTLGVRPSGQHIAKPIVTKG